MKDDEAREAIQRLRKNEYGGVKKPLDGELATQGDVRMLREEIRDLRTALLWLMS